MLSLARSTGKTRGIKINGEYLSHLIFADDIVLIAKSTSELQRMVQVIHETSKPVDLNMHLGKTKVMCNPGELTKQTLPSMEGRSKKLTTTSTWSDGDKRS